MSSDVAPRLDSTYVEETVGRLEGRIRARFPDRRLGDAAHALKTAVPQIHEGFEASKSRRRRIRWAARAASVVIVLAAVGALVLALRDLVQRLRSLAHVVDMHQLDEDPEQARADYHPTSVSPVRRIMDAEELHHYLDYCSELVSLIAKTAALCAERTSDPVVLGTVS